MGWYAAKHCSMCTERAVGVREKEDIDVSQKLVTHHRKHGSAFLKVACAVGHVDLYYTQVLQTGSDYK